MKNLILKTIFLLSFPIFLFSQTLNVHKSDGTVQNFLISEIDSITFTSLSSISFFEDFESGTITNYIALGYNGASWNLISNAFAGNYSLEGVTDDGSTGHRSLLINPNTIFTSDRSYKIDAYIKNTSLVNWNRPNGIIFSASSDSLWGYVPLIEHNIYLSLIKITSTGYEFIVPRTELVNINTDEWYHWVVYFEPLNHYSRFELYDLSGSLLGSIETYETPFLSDKIGFELWRGNGVYDNISVIEW